MLACVQAHVAALALGQGPVDVLDLATGTADLALAVHRAHPAARVTGLDPSPVMLEIAARKCAGKPIELVPGDAQALPFAAGSFDGITMGFGIRNVPDRALQVCLLYTSPSPRD